jgi:PTS system mannose-specific IID component
MTHGNNSSFPGLNQPRSDSTGEHRSLTPSANQGSQNERRLLMAVYLRSLALQASWNSQRMQNLGLLVALLPGLRRLSLSLFERRRFFRRHYEFFNTNPYLANSLLGGLLRLEQEQAAGSLPVATIRTFKNTLARSIASVGDQLFWLGLKPLLLLVMTILVIQGQILAVPLVIGFFLLAQLILRWRALMAGYRFGLDIVDWLSRPFWYRAIAMLKKSGMFATGILAGSYVVELLGNDATRYDWPFWLVAAVTACVPLVFRLRLTAEGGLFILLPLALLLAAI